MPHVHINDKNTIIIIIMKLQLFLELPLEKRIVRRSDSKRTLLKQDRTMEENLIFQVL